MLIRTHTKHQMQWYSFGLHATRDHFCESQGSLCLVFVQTEQLGQTLCVTFRAASQMVGP